MMEPHPCGCSAAHDSGGERYLELCPLHAAADDLLAACKAARHAMTNQRYLKPRIGMEAECAAVDAAIAKATEHLPAN